MLSGPIQEFAKKISNIKAGESQGGTEMPFEVNQLISKATNFYEKVRYLVDYKEEHTIRRSAIERILRRKIIIEQKQKIGLSLVTELVSSQYIPQTHLTENAVEAIDKTVAKFLELKKLVGQNSSFNKKILSLTASEIDRHLDTYRYLIDDAVIQTSYERVRGNIEIDQTLPENEVNIQLYCACRRNLLGFDDEMLMYTLWLMFVPNWLEIPENEVKDIAGNIVPVIHHIEAVIKNPLQWQLARRLKNEMVYFLIIRELVQQYGPESGRILENEVLLDNYVKSFLEKKYIKENERIKSSGLRAVIYLFFTKVILALLIEMPYESYFLHAINTLALSINIIFPPALLFAFTRHIKTLGEDNTKAVVSGIHTVVYSGEFRKLKVRTLTLYSRLSYVFTFFYLIFIALVFWGIIAVLNILHFNIVSMMFFILFLTLVSYFAFRIRHNAKRWRVIKEGGAWGTIGNVLALPIVNAGRWMSQSFSAINFVVFLLDFVVETPLKFILNFSNEFISYLKERVEEIR